VIYYCPGNHDIHTTNIPTYRQYFGNDYYSFKINNITFMVIDSQLPGDFDTFVGGQTPADVQPLPSSVQTESDTMERRSSTTSISASSRAYRPQLHFA
jgi:hypothetical protein